MNFQSPKSPEAYKDVKTNLRYYTTFIIVIISILLYIIYIGIDPGIIIAGEVLVLSGRGIKFLVRNYFWDRNYFLTYHCFLTGNYVLCNGELI